MSPCSTYHLKHTTLTPPQDNLQLNHWRRITEEDKEYPFVRFNKKLDIPTFTADEYQVVILYYRQNISNWESVNMPISNVRTWQLGKLEHSEAKWQ